MFQRGPRLACGLSPVFAVCVFQCLNLISLFTTKFTFSVKLNGATVGLTEAPRTVEDGSSLCNVDLRCVGLGRSDHHTRAADKEKEREAQVVNLPLYVNPATGY